MHSLTLVALIDALEQSGQVDCSSCFIISHVKISTLTGRKPATILKAVTSRIAPSNPALRDMNCGRNRR